MTFRQLSARVPEVPVIAITLVSMGIIMLAIPLLRWMGMNEVQGQGIHFRVSTAAVMLVMQVLLSWVVVVWAKKVDGWGLRELRLSGPWLCPALLGAALGSISSLGGVLWDLAHGAELGLATGGFSTASVVSWWVYMTGLMLTLNSLKEELLSRAYTVGKLRQRGLLYAVTFSAVLFALEHFFGEPPTLLRFVGLFLSGVFFAVVFLRTDSLWAAIGAHNARNFWLVLVGGNVQQGGLLHYVQDPTPTGLDAYVNPGLVILSTALVWFGLRRGLSKTAAHTDVERA